MNERIGRSEGYVRLVPTGCCSGADITRQQKKGVAPSSPSITGRSEALWVLMMMVFFFSCIGYRMITLTTSSLLRRLSRSALPHREHARYHGDLRTQGVCVCVCGCGCGCVCSSGAAAAHTCMGAGQGSSSLPPYLPPSFPPSLI